MVIFGLTLFIICVIGCVLLLAYGIYRSVKIVKHPMPKTIDYKREGKISGIISIGHGIIFGVCFIGAFLWQGYPLSALEWFLAIFGGIITGGAFAALIIFFILHYYGKEIPQKLDKTFFLTMIISLPLTIVGFFIFSDGWADFIPYPLPNIISFSRGLVTGNNGERGITFYALFILCGALFVFFLCDHIFYRQYGKHGLIESTFFVAFPAGIIGARIAYVIGEWDTQFAARCAKGEWWSIFAIWEGGLTILGGAIAGIIVGVLWFRWRNKGYNIWLAVDIIIPTILIAQAIGRWGNFFNCEVYGDVVSEKYWVWLPRIIFNQLHYTSTSSGALVGQVVVPLFLIESITNLLGYFVLAGVFGKFIRKYTELGDLAFGYLIWYGLTRVIMEPLRNPNFQMGKNHYWSWFWSLIFVLIGALCIAINHFARRIYREKKEGYVPQASWLKEGTLEGIIVVISSFSLMITGIYLMATNSFSGLSSDRLYLDAFNNGTICLVVGASILCGCFIFIPKIVEGVKALKIHHET